MRRVRTPPPSPKLGGIIYYIAGQGEKNDVEVGVNSILGGTVHVYTLQGRGRQPDRHRGRRRASCINGVGMCRQEFVNSFVIDLARSDDTVTVSTARDGPDPPANRAR